jgi:4'-phosphopantetheinyl transferase
MIRWLVHSVIDHPDLSAGRPPIGLLTKGELARYGTYLNPRRRRDWLLGRWTAKHLVQAHIVSTEGFSPALDTFTIEYESSGAPYVNSFHPALQSTRGTSRMPLALSISHSHGYAFCALCDATGNHTRLGVDIELVEQRSDDFVQEILTDEEQSRLQSLAPDIADLLITVTWSAKEALFKANHKHLRMHPQSVQCFPQPSPSRCWKPLQMERLDAPLEREAGGALRGWWRVLDNRLRPGTTFVLTIAAYGVCL